MNYQDFLIIFHWKKLLNFLKILFLGIIKLNNLMIMLLRDIQRLYPKILMLNPIEEVLLRISYQNCYLTLKFIHGKTKLNDNIRFHCM
jgi:hypothetical protein